MTSMEDDESADEESSDEKSSNEESSHEESNQEEEMDSKSESSSGSDNYDDQESNPTNILIMIWIPQIEYLFNRSSW